MRGPVLLATIALLGACKKGGPAGSTGPDASAPAAPAPSLAQGAPEDGGAGRALAPPPSAGHAFDVPAGSFESGSAQGDEGRDPSVEPAQVRVELGAFAVDALPYPNDPGAAPRAASLAEAERLCQERGQRLCSELEWERACKGPSGDPFASGPSWNPRCEKEPSRCASGFGPRAMGLLSEWTASRFAGQGTPVLRGGPDARRCAARVGGKDDATRAFFRCCKGPVNAAVVAPIPSRPAFRRAETDAEQLTALFAATPRLSPLGPVRLFDDADVKAITARNGGPPAGVALTTRPILWSPEAGAELLVATGRGKGASFVVAFWTGPEGQHRLASSFVMEGDVAPVALAYEPGKRAQLLWSGCWGCAGDQGSVSYRDDRRVVIVQH